MQPFFSSVHILPLYSPQFYMKYREIYFSIDFYSTLLLEASSVFV